MSVTVYDTTAWALPCTVKGKVAVNEPPVAVDAGFWNQVAAGPPSCTVKSLVAKALFEAGTKWNVALTNSPVFEKPVAEMVNAPVCCWKLTAVITGGAGLMPMVVVVSGPPLFTCPVSVIVPAVVPVLNTLGAQPAGNTACVPPAGIVKGKVRLLLQKAIIRSSLPTADAKARVRVPVKAMAGALPVDTVKGCCVLDGAVLGTPPMVTAGGAFTVTVMVLPVDVFPRESLTTNTMLVDPEVVGVPLIAPVAGSNCSPAGRFPEEVLNE